MVGVQKGKADSKKKTEDQDNFIKAFFSKYGKVLMVFAIAVLVLVVVVVVVTEVNKSRLESSTLAAEQLEELYFSYLTSEEESDAQPVIQLAQSIIDRYGNTIAAQRAYFFLGLVAENKENHDDAARYFHNLASIRVSSHLVEVALIRAFQNAEIAGNLSYAEELLQQLVTSYPNGIQTPRALYNLGRLAELQMNTPKALEFYTTLTLEFPLSNWTSLAKGRIISLE